MLGRVCKAQSTTVPTTVYFIRSFMRASIAYPTWHKQTHYWTHKEYLLYPAPALAHCKAPLGCPWDRGRQRSSPGLRRGWRTPLNLGQSLTCSSNPTTGSHQDQGSESTTLFPLYKPTRAFPSSHALSSSPTLQLWFLRNGEPLYATDVAPLNPSSDWSPRWYFKTNTNTNLS